MGIPRLTQYLRPYAVPGSLSDQDVVIDGSGFAYHIYHVCLSSKRTAKNQFETAISYEEIGKVSVAWLDALRESRVSIRNIYFDGFLPNAKQGVRIDRIVGQTQKLFAYHQVSPVPCRLPSAAAVRENGLQNLFSHRNVRENLNRLPPLPFLVPAVLEALLASNEYRAITAVVPGEADAYCAQSAKIVNGVVLTGDSDLLLYDLGQKGRVVFYRDIEADSHGQSDDLHGLIYQPIAIANRLGLESLNGLHILAFEMIMDTHASFRELLGRAKTSTAIGQHPVDYAEFQREYDHSPIVALSKSETNKTTAALRALDPRISEYVLQFSYFARIAGQYPQSISTNATPHVFLPFLLDCPTRTNAWETSMSTRQLAYGLVNLLVPDGQRVSSIYEHKRQEGKSGGREIAVPDASQIPEACGKLVTLLGSQLISEISSAGMEPTVDIWIAAAIYQDVEWSYNNSKQCLSQVVGPQFRGLKAGSDASWDLIHMYAQIQGSYYSFRILKQIIDLVISHDCLTSIPTEVVELHHVLQNLPSLRSIKDVTHVFSILTAIEEHGMIDAAQRILEITLPKILPKEAGKKKKKRKRGEEPISSKAETSRPRNPFEVLDME